MAGFFTPLEWQELNTLLSSTTDFDELPPPNSRPSYIDLTAGASSTGSRFVHYTSEEIGLFVAGQQNESTKKKTLSDMRLFGTFLQERGENREIQNILPTELDTLFSLFLLGARKANNKGDYEPTTLRGFMSSLDRHLVEKGCTYRVIKNPLFPRSNSALTAKQKELKSKGHGGKPNASDELTDEDIQHLANENIIGTHNPEALLNLLHLNFSLVLGMRGGKEQKQLKWGDIEVETDEDGDQYLVHIKERATKTRTGSDVKNIRKFKPKAWENDNPKICPVKAYKIYKSKRPDSMCDAESPFFLSINHAKNPNDDRNWFKACPMGITHIYGLIPRMVKQCNGIDSQNRKVTNHSARKHLVQKCVDMGLAPTDTVQVSGHKCLDSINNYSKMNIDKQKMVSKALSSCKVNHEKAGKQANFTESSIMAEVPASKPCEMKSSGVPYQQEMSSIFGSSTITGGTFNFNSMVEIPNLSVSPPKKRFRRILPIMSDSSDDDE